MTGYRVWAPAAEQRVDLVLGDERVALERGDDGWWQTDRAPRPGERYAFSVDGGDPRPDPRSLSQPDGPHEPARSST